MATANGISYFETAMGRCGVAWSDAGIRALHLPDASMRARLRRGFPDVDEQEPPREVQRTVDAVAALIRGEPSDLTAAPVDMEDLGGFQRRVYEATRTIPQGETRSYGEVASILGSPGAARAVGQALRNNPIAVVVPCHRVLATGGRIGGYGAGGGVVTKLRLLSLEAALAHAGSDEAGAALGFDASEAVEHLRESDPAMRRLVDEVGPLRLRLRPSPSLFVALAEAIVYQQLTGRAAATIYARMCALFPHGHEGPTPDHILRSSDERLRSAGLSGSKVRSLRDLARQSKAGVVPSVADAAAMADDALVERLTTVRGVGRWTVEMLLIFRLGRPDVLPVDDYGVRKGFAAAIGRGEMPGRRELEERGERWRPYRTAASWYLWRAAERGKKSGGGGRA